MSQKSELVIDALVALIRGAVSTVGVERNADDPARIPADGWIVVRDGDPGVPEMLLSPLSYSYSHAIRVEVAAPGGTKDARKAKMDALLTPIGAAILANRTLGGLCDWIEPSLPERDTAGGEGMVPTLWASFDVIATYVTANPLG